MHHSRRAVAATALATVSIGLLGACSPGTAGGAEADAAGDTYTWWDPYPQHEEGSDWAGRVQACGEEAGVTIERTAYDTTALTNQALFANPNPLGRHADISVNGGETQRVMFPPTFHANNFWERTVVLDLAAGENSVSLRAEELPNSDGVTYASDTWTGLLLRADEAPVVDRITVSPLAAPLPREK